MVVDTNNVWPSQMDDDALGKYVRSTFLKDALWRSKMIGGETAYEQMLRLYESDGQSSSGSDIPELPQIREPVNDAISLAVSTNQLTRLKSVERIDPRLSPAERKFFLSVLKQAEDINNRHVDNILATNQWQDLRTKALKQAGIFGVGYICVELADRVDTRIQFAARRLEKKPLEMWDDRDFALYNILMRHIGMRHVDTRGVFWQEGVTSAYGEDMLRVSELRKRSLREMRSLYPDKDIRPGGGSWGVDTLHLPAANDRAETVAELTTWHLETNPVVKILGSDEAPEAQIPFTGWLLTRVKMAGTTLLERKTFDGSDGPLSLPIVPFYLLESENHAYGFSLAKALKITSDYINSMYTLQFEQARKSVSPQSVAILASKLAKTDNIEQIVEDLRNGEAVMLWGNQNVDKISDIMQPTGQLVSQLSPAPMQAIQMAERLLQKYSANPDRDAIARAESGKAKDTEVAIADRTKAPMSDIVARSDELIKDVIYENVRIYHNNTVDVPIREQDGAVNTATLNKSEFKILPVPDPITGMPMTHESFVVPHLNPQGYVYKRFDYVANSTQIDMKAEAEGRGDLPVSWQSRVRLFATLGQLGALRSMKTMRDYALPEEIAARDDINYQEDQAEAMQQMQQQMALQMQMQGQAPGQPPGPGGPTREQQRQNAITGRNAPQPVGAVRDLRQEMAMESEV